MITYLQNNYPEVLSDLVEHLWLALIPVVVGAALSLPLGYLAVRVPSLYQPVVNVGAVLYSIPSLALFLMIPVIIGVGYLSPLNVLIGLSLYTLALLARTVADALISVQGETTQAARALGYRPLRQLFGVELPMAAPVIFAGLRVATVANISLVSVGALVGSGGLGNLFTGGFQLGFVEPIIIGIVLSMLLAGLCDVGLVLLQR
ncbi:MAG TPA: ABC transporter permease, partial [Nocardioidaceae bacterium]|nr:ABC transporter permease [Nocardioidaceae bacterium]